MNMKPFLCAVSTVAVLLGVQAVVATPAHGQTFRNLADRTILMPTSASPDLIGGPANGDDCDIIEMVSSPPGSIASGGGVEVQIQTADQAPWWKAIELFVDGRQAPYNARAEGSGGVSSSLPVLPDELARAQLVLVKPKFLGAATRVYQVVGLDRAAGRSVTFIWRRDHCP
jgi:hypothetical protein